MARVGSAVLVVLALFLAPTTAEGQYVLRDDTGGWGWLALTSTHRAVVQLVYGSPQTGDQGQLDRRLLQQLRAMGVRRIWESSEFEPSENQVIAECAALDYTPPGASEQVYSIHTEVSYWDSTRLAAAEIYEAITLNRIAPTDLATDTYVDACAAQLSGVLVRLGFDEG
jgi:hypothetical protein